MMAASTDDDRNYRTARAPRAARFTLKSAVIDVCVCVCENVCDVTEGRDAAGGVGGVGGG